MEVGPSPLAAAAGRCGTQEVVSLAPMERFANASNEYQASTRLSKGSKFLSKRGGILRGRGLRSGWM